MEDVALKETPLLGEHRALGAKLAPFGGWLMPIQYESIIAEHNWTRQSASLFDICHMGEFLVYGDAKESNLNNIVTMDLPAMECGSCHYGFMLNEDGQIIDDLIVYRIEDKKWMLVVNAATTDKDNAHLRKHLSQGVKLENISEATAKIDLQGPLSGEVISDLIDKKVSELKYYNFSNFNILGDDAIISRTGYTGELGYEVYIKSKKVNELWNLLLSDKRVKPAGLGARDTLRLEMGYPLYGQDITDATTPIEAGLKHFVDFNKDFIGKGTLIEQKEKGPARVLAYFKTDTRRSPRHNDKILFDGKEIGIVTSGSFSPSLSCGIGAGYIESIYSKTGTAITIKSEKSEIRASIVKRPFYKKSTVKI